MTAWHFGPLHPVEQALVLLVAFGPFVVLAVVLRVVRRRERDEHESSGDATEPPSRWDEDSVEGGSGLS